MSTVHDISDLRVFLLITETGSLAEAARRLGVTTSAMSQRLRNIEEKLGVQLALRSARLFVLTQEGELFRKRAALVIGEIDALVNEMRELAGELGGDLNVVAPRTLGRRYLAPVIAEFHALYPGLRVWLTAQGSALSEGAEYRLVIQAGMQGGSDTCAFPLAPNTRLLCAAPRYLATRNVPHHPKELDQHDCVLHRDGAVGDAAMWRFRRGASEVCAVGTPVLISDDMDVVRQWAVLGKGLIIGSECELADLLRAGLLVRMLADWSLPDADLVALAPDNALTLRGKLFLDFMRERLNPPRWRVVSDASQQA